MDFYLIISMALTFLGIIQFLIPKDLYIPIKWRVAILLSLILLSLLLINCGVGNKLEKEISTPEIVDTPFVTYEQSSVKTPEIKDSEIDTSVLRAVDAPVIDKQYVELETNGHQDSYGNNYFQELYFNNDFYGGNISFSINGEYSVFSGIIAVGEHQQNGDADLYLEIFADSSSIYNTTIKKIEEPKLFSIDVSGVQTIKIVCDGYIIIGNSEFSRNASYDESVNKNSEGVNGNHKTTRSLDVHVVDSSCVDLYEHTHTDTFGNKYRQEIYFSSDTYGGNIIFATLGDYTKFTGIIAVCEYEVYAARDLYIEIFADDVSIYTAKVKKTDEPIYFDLDISNARKIEIKADGYIIVGDGNFYS